MQFPLCKAAREGTAVINGLKGLKGQVSCYQQPTTNIQISLKITRYNQTPMRS